MAPSPLPLLLPLLLIIASPSGTWSSAVEDRLELAAIKESLLHGVYSLDDLKKVEAWSDRKLYQAEVERAKARSSEKKQPGTGYESHMDQDMGYDDAWDEDIAGLEGLAGLAPESEEDFTGQEAPADNPAHAEDEARKKTYQEASMLWSFILSSGLLSEHVPQDEQKGAMVLIDTVQVLPDAAEVALAVAYRFANGRGYRLDCGMGLAYATNVADELAIEGYSNVQLQVPVHEVRLRQKWLDPWQPDMEEMLNNQYIMDMEDYMASRGSGNAVGRRGYRRLVGQGLEQDAQGAYADFQAAADQGDPYALFNMGFMHMKGVHGPPNSTKALEYFHAAAEKGLAAAYNGLGVMYFEGQGVEKNVTAARVYFEQCAAMDNADCYMNLASLYWHGIGVTRNETLGVEYYHEAEELGHWRAAYSLASAYRHGVGVEKDCETAQEYMWGFLQRRPQWHAEMQLAFKAWKEGDLRRALWGYMYLAHQGNEVAAANGAWLLTYGGAGKGFPRQWVLKTAKALYQQSAILGATDSMVELGHLMMEHESPSELPGSVNSNAQGEEELSMNSAEVNFEDGDELSIETDVVLDADEFSGEAEGILEPGEGDRLSTDGDNGVWEEVELLSGGPSWYQAAAALDDLEGLYYLALCYQQGRGVQKSYQRALDLLWRATQLPETSNMVAGALWLRIGQAYFQQMVVAYVWSSPWLAALHVPVSVPPTLLSWLQPLMVAENLLMTVLIGALTVVLWMRRRLAASWTRSRTTSGGGTH